jgi:branched-subunit amino acid ABC-type transport system permease component
VSAYLPFIVIGLATGSVYAIAAMGLTVTYTTSGVFNFAHGAVGMIATFIFYSLRVDLGLPTPLAMAIAVLGVGPAVGIVIDRVLLRRLDGASAATYVVISLGLLVALQGLAIWIYGPATRSMDAIFPRSTFRLPGVNVGWDQVILVAIAAVAGLGLAAFFRFSRLGIQTRAVVDDPGLTELEGLDSGRITTFSWMLGCSFAALAGVLLAPLLGVDAVLLTLLAIQVFGAAVIGRLTSLPLTYLGAMVIGLGQALATKLVTGHQSLSGLPTSLPFIILFAVLVLSPKGFFQEVVRARAAAVRIGGRALGRRFPWPALIALTAVALVIPARLNGAQLLTATSTLGFVLVFASLSLLIGLSRQVSLCHAVFVVFGATTLSHLRNAGMPYLPALLLAALAMVPVGAIVAIPAIRLSGLFLALATFGFGILAQNLLFLTKFAFGAASVVRINRPEVFGIDMAGDKSFYYFVLILVILGVVAVEAVRVTRLGRVLRALADSPVATESLGINPTAARVIVFCVGAFLAAIAGGLLGTLTQVVNTSTFDFFQSLVWVTVLVTTGAATLGGSVLASLLLITAPTVFTSKAFIELQPVFFGVAAILLAQARNGLVGLVPRPDFAALADRSAWRTGSRRLTERSLPDTAVPSATVTA